VSKKLNELYTLQASYENYVTLTTTKATATRYAKALESFFNRFPDRLSPEDFTRRDIEDYRIWRMRENISPRTINYEVNVLRAFWNWLTQMERVTWNPASQVKRFKEKDSPKTSLSLVEQQALVKGCFSSADRLLLALALCTGLRGETLSKLEKSDVDFANCSLSIGAEKMKAGRNHVIPLPPAVIEMLEELPDGRIFEGYAGSTNSLRHHWNAICRRAGISLRGIRTARRTFATTLIRSGADLKIVQDLLGHKSILTTGRYITPADQQTVRDAVDKLPVLVFQDET
jgi:integrase/recombinase XerD